MNLQFDAKDKMRIRPVPLRNDRCYLCAQLMPCRHIDLDFRGAPICGDIETVGDCAHAIVWSEFNLRYFGKCTVPTDSIMEDHA